MEDRATRIAQANTLLASYAVPHDGTLGREHAEEEDATRFPFQRDRGRIVHTQEFRRLKGKTQVFVGSSDDHYRTRLTHTMEVAGVSRDIARTLQLNEDLAECIALAHDLGHPPFGHAGEEALNMGMKNHSEHFEHNDQSLRIVTVLAEHSKLHSGLNLHMEILEGLQKHRTPFDTPTDTSLPRSPSLEAQVVNIADEIDYTAHDSEDGLSAGLFSLEEICTIPLAKRASSLAESRGTSLRGSLIHILVEDLYKATKDNIVSQRITTLDDVYSAENSVVMFSETLRSDLDDLREFLLKNMYQHTAVADRNSAGKTILVELCDAFLAKPIEKILTLQEQTSSSLPIAVKDYVCGMTDAYALNLSGA